MSDVEFRRAIDGKAASQSEAPMEVLPPPGGGQGGKTHSRTSYGVQQAVLRVRAHANIMNAGGRGEQMSRSAPPAF